ncbi:MAG TPA: hypothetical protein VMV10_21675 [Pirellulales bacterium]|nr:hypothetical protein [Pirellulales bacterium]
MSHRPLLVAPLLAAFVLAAWQTPSFAQGLGQFKLGQFKNNPPPPYDGKGQIAEVAPQGIQFTDADGKTMIVGFDQKTKFTVTGTAEPGFLAPGLLVRFTAVITGKGQVEEKIKELAVVERTPDTNEIGAQPDLQPGQTLKEAEKEGPVSWLVVGQIRSFKNNQLMVVANKAIRAEVAEDCKITVDVNTYTIAREGDEIKVTGKLLREFQKVAEGAVPGQVLAEKVEITLVKPLTAPGKKKGAARARTARKKKAKQSDD